MIQYVDRYDIQHGVERPDPRNTSNYGFAIKDARNYRQNRSGPYRDELLPDLLLDYRKGHVPPSRPYRSWQLPVLVNCSCSNKTEKGVRSWWPEGRAEAA